MTSPRLAEATAKGRYYQYPQGHPKHGEPGLISVTNVLSVAMAKPALIPWAAKIVAEHAMDHLPQIVARSRTDRDGTTRDLKAQVTIARDKAADLGTRIHALAEAHVTGQQLAHEDVDEEAAAFVDHYLAFLKDFDVQLDRDIVAAEMTVAYPSLGYAGTLDLIVNLPIGVETVAGELKPYPLPDGERRPWMVDLKTSATRPSTSIYPEYALQLTALRQCREAWLPDDSVQPLTGVIAAAVLNLRRSTYALIPLPSGQPEWDTFRGALAVAKWVHSEPIAQARPVTPRGRAVPKQARTRKTATTSRKVA